MCFNGYGTFKNDVAMTILCTIYTEHTVIYIVGSLKAEVLSPSGKLKVNIRKPEADQIEVAFTAKEEGK